MNNSEEKITSKEGKEEEDTRPNAKVIAQEIATHLPFWKEGIKISFWAHVSIREVNETKCKSVQELFARWKIAPKWKSIDELFYESLKDFFPEHRNKSGVDIEVAFGSLTVYLDSMLKFVFGTTKGKVNPIASKTKEEVCIKLQEYAKKLPETYQSLFPAPLGYHLQNLYMALSQSQRDKWSERTWDNIVYADVFHRYFIDEFPVQSSDQTLSGYLPIAVQNSVAPDLVLFSDRSPFLISEWGEAEHASNHKDLTKIVETKREVLFKRAGRYLDSTNYVYGVLGGGEKLTVFRMEHDRANKLYNCYLLSDEQDDLCTTTCSFENIATILRINIILMIGGKLQKLGVGKRGAEKSSTSLSVTTATPDKIDNSSALKSTKTTKKRNIKKCSSMTELHKPKSSTDDDDDDDTDTDMSRDFAKKLVFDTNNSTTPSNNTNVTQNEEKKTSRGGSKKKPTEAVDAYSSSDLDLIGKKINDKYTVKKKLTSCVYIVSRWDDFFIAKFNVTSKKLAKEETILADLSNRFLKPIESFQWRDKVRCMIFPYVRSVEWKNTKDFTERAFALISAINELHEKNIAHSDIKYSNVICGQEGTYLIDFDLALRMNGKFNGTFGYRAPEAMRYGRLSLKMDVYSYGILLFELASFESIHDNPLTYDDNEEQMAASVREEIQKMGLATPWHEKLVALIDKCMTEDIDKRPTAKQIMEDPFFDSVRDTKTKDSNDKKQRSIVNKPFQDITNTWQSTKFV